jgi:predicted small secreted protein
MAFSMKKLVLISILVLTVLTITACANAKTGNKDKSQDTAHSANDIVPAAPDTAISNVTETAGEDGTTTPAAETSGFALKVGDSIIKMDQNMAEVQVMLGEPRNVFEEASCAFDGIDRVFSYPGLQIHTYPKGSDDYVHTISLRDDGIRTMQGIYLGSTMDAVVKAYGDEYKMESDVLIYTKDQTTLSFFIEDDIVTAITYNLIMK